jgi:hypothetical protein
MKDLWLTFGSIIFLITAIVVYDTVTFNKEQKTLAAKCNGVDGGVWVLIDRQHICASHDGRILWIAPMN